MPTGDLRWHLPALLATDVGATLDNWQVAGKLGRLWARDATVWTGADEASWLGWLDVVARQRAQLPRLTGLADEVRADGVTHALLIGMGGSSLGPEVLAATFGPVAGFPRLYVLDSTDPAQILTFERRLDLAHTLVIVSSKSGTTLEPNILFDYFFERLRAVVGPGAVGRHFIAITDPGSALHGLATRHGFRHTFFGEPSIGGRYSVLSDFGMVPAAIAGVDVARLLQRADEMVSACADPTVENPGLRLGVALGCAAAQGRDKVTLVTSPGVAALGAWLEQLLAESTGKSGKGLIPIDREALGPPSAYGDDRIFVYTRLDAAPDTAQDAAIATLEATGQPVVRISLATIDDLGQEFFRWEFATAVAGALLGINPFDQPDVEASKDATRALSAAYEQTGTLPAEPPMFAADGIRLYADAANAAALASARPPSLAGYLTAHLSRLGPGDYCALLAYLDMNPAHEAALQAIRHQIRDTCRVATALGFGPRFLHSTGQLYKGGPNTGVFLQLTCDDAADLPVPGRRYRFGVVKAAQARGDFQVLNERFRRVLHVHLGPDVPAGLARLHAAITEALRP